MHTLEEKLSRARQTLGKIRISQLRTELLWRIVLTLTATVALWLTMLLVLSIIPLDTSIRWLLLFIAILFPLTCLFRDTFKVLSNPIYQKGKIADEHWALVLGNNAQELIRDRLLNALQIYENRHMSESRDLAYHSLLLVVSDLEQTSTEDISRIQIPRNALFTLGIVCFAFILSFVLFPSGMKYSTNLLINPSMQVYIPPSHTIILEPKGGWAYRGEPVEFHITVEGPPVRDVDFVWRYTGGEAQRNRVNLRDNTAAYTVNGFQESIEYSVILHNIQSETHRLRMVSRPQIVEFRYVVVPPRYSGLSRILGRENVGDVEGLYGSQVELNLRSSKNLSQALLIFSYPESRGEVTDTLKMNLSGSSANIDFKITRESRYHFALQDTEGHWNRDPISYRIRMLPDDPPVVRIAFPDVDVEIGEEMLLPLLVEADDDYAVSRIDILYHRLDYDEKEPSSFSLLTRGNKPSQSVDHLWNMAAIDLMPGDVVEYWARAWDNDNLRGPKSSDSEKRLVRLPSIEEIIARIERQEEMGMDQAEQTLDLAKELREDVNKLVEELRRNPEMDWERKRQMEEVLDKQEELEKFAETLAKQIEELINSLEQNNLASDETLEKYMELQKLISEIVTPELKEAMEKLRQAMESQDPDQMRAALEQFDFDRESFLESIERTSNILKQLQLERRLDELVKQVENLLHQQERILELTPTGDPEKVSSEQENLINPTETFQKRLDETIQLARDNREVATADNLQDIADKFQEAQLPSEMKSAASDIAQGNKQDASERGENIARELASTFGELSQTAINLRENRKSELTAKMRRIVEEMLYVSSALNTSRTDRS